MTLYAWIDEHGKWRVSHFPPADDSAALMISLAEGSSVLFFDQTSNDLVDVEVR